MTVRVRLAACALMVAGATLSGCAEGVTAYESCSRAQPQIEVVDGPLAPGARITVEGRFFLTGCEEPEPETNLVLAIRQGGEVYVLGSTDARAYGEARWTVVLPERLELGPARLRGGLSQVLDVWLELPAPAGG